MLYSDGAFLELVGVLDGLWRSDHVRIRRRISSRFLLKPGHPLHKKRSHQTTARAPPKRGLRLGVWPVVVDLALGARLGVPSYAVVDEVMPLNEMDGGILLGCLGLA